MTQAYIEYRALLGELNTLETSGQGNSPLANQIRQQLVALWPKLTPVEQQTVLALAAYYAYEQRIHH